MSPRAMCIGIYADSQLHHVGWSKILEACLQVSSFSVFVGYAAVIKVPERTVREFPRAHTCERRERVSFRTAYVNGRCFYRG